MNKILILFYFIILISFLYFYQSCKAQIKIVNLNTKIENYIKKNNPSLKREQYELIAKIIIEQSLYYKVPHNLTLAMMKVESNFNSDAISLVGALGLMQVYTMECFNIEKELLISAKKLRLFEIEYNIAFGLCLFCEKLKIAKNNWIKAITLYNGSGPDARKYTLKVLDILNKINKEFY